MWIPDREDFVKLVNGEFDDYPGTPEGDFIVDALNDDSFPWEQDWDAVQEFLRHRRASKECIDAARKLYSRGTLI